jgi:hypothetical protein
MADLVMSPKEYGKRMRKLNRSAKNSVKSSMKINKSDVNKWFGGK